MYKKREGMKYMPRPYTSRTLGKNYKPCSLLNDIHYGCFHLQVVRQKHASFGGFRQKVEAGGASWLVMGLQPQVNPMALMKQSLCSMVVHQLYHAILDFP